MDYIYIAFVDTPGIFASIIRRTIRQKYIHVVLSFDAQLNDAYSIGRRDPFIPIIAGMEKEEKDRILLRFPDAEYQVCRIAVTSKQKKQIRETVMEDYENRAHIHYDVIGLPFILFGIKFHIKNQFTCSSYLAKLLDENGIRISDKYFSLVTPRDFYEYPQKEVIFEGRLADLCERRMMPTFRLLKTPWSFNL